MEPVERVRWQSTEAYERPLSLMQPVKSPHASVFYAEMPTANSVQPSIRAPLTSPAFLAVELFAAAYRDPAPANTQMSWSTGLADIIDLELIEVLADAEPADTG